MNTLANNVSEQRFFGVGGGGYINVMIAKTQKNV